MKTPSNCTPRVTVVMPCFNANATIAPSIASIRAQTFEDWELIVIDDGSNDESRLTVLKLAAEDHRIRLYIQKNAGPAAARSRGVAMAQGDVIAFLDSDDIWRADHLSCALEMIEADATLGIAFAPCQHMTAEGRPTGHVTRSWTSGITMADILACNPTATCSSLVVRKDVFETAGDMRADMVHAEDQDWLFRVARTGWGIRSHTRPTVLYRSNPYGLSADVEKMYRGWCAFIENARHVEPGLVDRQLPAAKASMHLYYARRLMRDGDFRLRTLGHVGQAVAASPTLVLRRPKATLGTAALALAGSVSPRLATEAFTTLGRAKHA